MEDRETRSPERRGFIKALAGIGAGATAGAIGLGSAPAQGLGGRSLKLKSRSAADELRPIRVGPLSKEPLPEMMPLIGEKATPPPFDRSQALHTVRELPGGRAALRDLGIGTQQAIDDADVSDSVAGMEGDDALLQAYVDGVTLTPTECVYTEHETITQTPVTYTSYNGYLSLSTLREQTCRISTTGHDNLALPILSIRMHLPGGVDDYLTYVIEMKLRYINPTSSSCVVKLNGTEVSFLETMDDTYMLLAEMPGAQRSPFSSESVCDNFLSLFRSERRYALNGRMEWITVMAV